MNNFIFENSSKVYFGEGCVKEYLSNILSAYGDTVMLCYGGGSIKKNGIYDEVITVLKKENKAVVEFSGIPSNPTYSKVLEGVKLAKESNADLILAVGGGSVMDCCKAISLGAKYDGDIWADFWARPGVIDFEPLPLGIIVTVSGTGSECNGGAVITNEELKIKTGKDYPQLNAKFVMLDSTYTYSVPEFQMVSGAFDTLSHIMEIYFSEPNESNVSDDISEALMKNVITNLRAAIKNPEDYTARSNLMWDATMAENRIIKLGKKTDFEATKWSTSSAHTLTAITVQVLPFFILFITDIFARQAKRNLLSLQLMFGVFQRTAKQTKSLQRQVLRPWQILLRKSVCRQPLRNLELMKISTLKKLQTHAALYRVHIKR